MKTIRPTKIILKFSEEDLNTLQKAWELIDKLTDELDESEDLTDFINEKNVIVGDVLYRTAWDIYNPLGRLIDTLNDNDLVEEEND